MDTKINSSSAFTFSGSVPHHYEECLGPMFFEPYALEVAERIKGLPVHLTLEIACGTGRVTRHLRKAIPATAKLIASDISPDMLAVARKKLQSADIQWEIIDAQELPFDDKSFDLLVCCFGFMFLADRAKGFSEAYRVLRPGGTLLLTTWDKLEVNAASFVYRRTAKKYLQDPLPEAYNLPFSLSDDRIISSYFENAGFGKFTIENVRKVCFSSSAREATEGLAHGGSIYNEIMKRNPAWMEEIKSTVEKELSQGFGAAPMRAPMSAIVSTAWK